MKVGGGGGVEGPCFWGECLSRRSNEVVCIDEGIERWLGVGREGGRDAWRGFGPFFCQRGGIECSEDLGWIERASYERRGMDLRVGF